MVDCFFQVSYLVGYCQKTKRQRVR